MGRKKEIAPAEEEENGKQLRKKVVMTKTITRGRKRKQSHTSEEEEKAVKLTNKEKSSDHVSNSKRRKGLFSKAAQLCDLFDDTRLAILLLSKAGKPYGFGHTSVYDFLNDHYTPTSRRASEGLDMSRKAQEYKNVTRMMKEIENEMRTCQTLHELALFRNKYSKLNEEIEEELSRRHSYNDERSLVSMHATNDVTTRNPLLATSESDYSTVQNCGLAENGGFGIGGNEWSLPLCQNGGDTCLANPISSIGGNSLGHEVVSNISSPNFTNPTNLCSTTNKFGLDVGDTSLSNPTINGNRYFLRELLGLENEVVSGNSSSDLTTTFCLSNFGVEHGFDDVGNTSSMGPTMLDVGGNVLPELGCDKRDEIYCSGIIMSTMRSNDNNGNSSSELTNGIRENSLSSTSNYGADDHGNSLRDSATYSDLSNFDNFDRLSDFARCNNGALERVEPSSKLVQSDSNEGYFSYLN